MSLRDRLFSNPALFRRVMSLYPPYLGAGIRVKRVGADFSTLEVEMRERWYNRNALGTHFGGSLYAMVDPFYVLMLIAILGRDYIIWDRAAEIEFLRPGRGTVTARFELEPAFIAEIRERAATGAKFQPERIVEVRDADGELVARVKKVLYIRRKPPKQSGAAKAA